MNSLFLRTHRVYWHRANHSHYYSLNAECHARYLLNWRLISLSYGANGDQTTDLLCPRRALLQLGH